MAGGGLAKQDISNFYVRMNDLRVLLKCRLRTEPGETWSSAYRNKLSGDMGAADPQAQNVKSQAVKPGSRSQGRTAVEPTRAPWY